MSWSRRARTSEVEDRYQRDLARCAALDDVDIDPDLRLYLKALVMLGPTRYDDLIDTFRPRNF